MFDRVVRNDDVLLATDPAVTAAIFRASAGGGVSCSIEPSQITSVVGRYRVAVAKKTTI